MTTFDFDFQLFFQYTVMDEEGKPTKETVVLTGEIMITKFPCLQTGDVRKMVAVDVESLHCIKDCVVFPIVGDRPHPDEMGGSDLDGDEYAIFWDTGLIFPINNSESMIFPYGINQVQKEEINVQDIIKFYFRFLMHNNIGRVANCHLVFSDLHPLGLLSDECANLATQYSLALDFQKTGYYEMLSTQYQFKIRPDFMANPSRRTYLSRRILGQLYRHYCLLEVMVELSADNGSLEEKAEDSSPDEGKENKSETFLGANPHLILDGKVAFVLVGFES